MFDWRFEADWKEGPNFRRNATQYLVDEWESGENPADYAKITPAAKLKVRKNMWFIDYTLHNIFFSSTKTNIVVPV